MEGTKVEFSDIRKETLRQAQACWNCKHGVFNHRASSSLARIQGKCTLECGDVPWPRSWVPHTNFWEDLNASTFFKDDWEKFLAINGPRYYGEKLQLELEFGDGLYVDMDQVRREWEWMKWISDRREALHTVGALQVCNLHRKPKG